MTIEFHCPHCQKLLKTADDKAGVRANCPGCGESVTVPELAMESAHADPTLVVGDVEPETARRPAAPADIAGAAGETKACPMCGAQIKVAATRCRFCGEHLTDRPTGQRTQIEAGDILN